MKQKRPFVCLGCQTTITCDRKGNIVEVPSPCPGILCSEGKCHRYIIIKGGCIPFLQSYFGKVCRPSKVCDVYCKKIKKEEEKGADADDDKIELYSSIHCGNKSEKCRGCVAKMKLIKSF